MLVRTTVDEMDEQRGGRGTREGPQPVAGPRFLLRLCPAISGMTAPIVFAAAVTIAGLIRPGYNPLSQFISELGVGAHAWIYNGAVIALGALELPFFLRLTSALAPTRAPRIVRVLLVIFCGTTCFLAIVPTRHRIALQDASLLHVVAFVTGVICLIVALWLLGTMFAGDPRWYRLSRPSQAIAVIACVFLVAPVALGPGLWYQWAGLIQRVFVGTLLAWLEVLATVLLRIDLACAAGARTAPNDPVR